MRLLLALFFILGLFVPSLADERIPFLLETDPAGASVTDGYGNKLSPTGTPGYIDASLYGESIDLTVELDGYEPKTFYVRLVTVRSHQRYPEEGKIALTPTSIWVPAKRFFKNNVWAGPLLLFILLASGIGAGVVRTKMHRQGERLETLARFESGASKKGSLLMNVLGGYRLIDVLGKGGMATVYRGVPDDTLKATDAVAVKVLSQAETKPQDFADRFRREVQVYLGLTHPNIVSLIDWGEHEGWTYLVLELVDGEELSQRAATLSRAELIEILGCIMQAMSFAHSEGVVHRDLKPENVMLTKRGKVMVMDFGLARSEDAKKITQTGAALGTPAYMAPEQIQAGPLDPRTDQYGIGVMAFELLTGQLPFNHEDPVQVIFSHLSQKRPNPSDVTEDLPSELGDVIVRMMAIDPNDRYPTMVEAHTAFMEASRTLLELQVR